MSRKSKLQKSKNQDNSGDGGKLLSQRDDCTESCTEEEDGCDNDDMDEDEDDDFVCVPMSNIDKDTMTFKNSEKLKISLRGTDRIESARKCDS